MLKQRRNMVSFAAAAIAGLAAYLWIANDTLQPQLAHAAEVSTATMGAAPTVSAVPQPGLWELFEQEKKAAPAHELPPQF
jgi:hypothetical protein